MKNELKFASWILLGLLPALVFLDFALGVRMARDYGFLESIGFALTLVFYAECSKRAGVNL